MIVMRASILRNFRIVSSNIRGCGIVRLSQATRAINFQLRSSTNQAPVSDAKVSWIDKGPIPIGLRPYLHLARADKQIGSLLLLLPCYWGVALAAPEPSLLLMAKFAVGAVSMRSAGCIINDIWDKNFDKNVERTKTRPLASGVLTVPQALGFLTTQLGLGLCVLLSLNAETVLLGFCSMPLVIAYPAMKRITNYPQFVLGLTFNWGVLCGYSAVKSGSGTILDACTTADFSLSFASIASSVTEVATLCSPALPLYFSGVCWTLVYDTIYGYQDRADDAKLGLKSTSLHFGDKPQLILSALTSGVFGGLLATGWLHGDRFNDIYYVCSSAACAHLMWQVWTMDVNSRDNLWYRFQSNQYTGAIIATGLIVGQT